MDPNIAIGKISLLNNQPQDSSVSEQEFLKTCAAGHRGVRFVKFIHDYRAFHP